MSVADMLNTTITLKRQTATKTRGGGASYEWPTVVLRNEPAMVQTASSRIALQYAQRNEQVDHVLYCARDIGARAGNLIEEEKNGRVRKFLVMGATYDGSVGFEEAWLTPVLEQPG